jgi:hypothetical protein
LPFHDVQQQLLLSVWYFEKVKSLEKRRKKAFNLIQLFHPMNIQVVVIFLDEKNRAFKCMLFED